MFIIINLISKCKDPTDKEAPPLPKKEKQPLTTEEKDHAMALALQRQLQLEDEEQAAAGEKANKAQRNDQAVSAGLALYMSE